jgi:hypothetical protein
MCTTNASQLELQNKQIKIKKKKQTNKQTKTSFFFNVIKRYENNEESFSFKF